MRQPARRYWLRVAILTVVMVGVVPAVSSARHKIEFEGAVESLPATSGWIGEWKVAGMTVVVDATTKIDQEDGPVAVGAYVEVEGVPQRGGAVKATEVEVEMPAARTQ